MTALGMRHPDSRQEFQYAFLYKIFDRDPAAALAGDYCNL